jgi:hypothetical protein
MIPLGIRRRHKRKTKRGRNVEIKEDLNLNII